MAEQSIPELSRTPIIEGLETRRENPFCSGDPEVTAIICSLDNLPTLQKQINVMMKEVGKIIVVNNGSRDGTKEWLEENPVNGMLVINRKNLGAGPGRNEGLELWDKDPTPYTLMLDGGILPPFNGVKAMKSYMLRHPDVMVISPEIASCYTGEEDQATLIYNQETIDDQYTFPQRALSGTAYCLCRAEAWKVRFSEEGPYGEPGWGVDDNDMQYRWNDAGVLHHDFVSQAGMILLRRASGSFQRLFEETGVWPNQYGSVYEKRLVKLNQDYPNYQNIPPHVSCVVLGWNEYPIIAKCVKRLHDEFRKANICYEIIVVDNGSMDETPLWALERRYRQHHGNTIVDVNGNIIPRTPENEEYWTGDFRYFRSPTNVGTGAGFNIGFDKCRGEYIFFVCGDILPVPDSVVGLVNWLKDNPDVSYAGVNAWMSEEKDDFVFDGYKRQLGLGNYAYSYAVIRRSVLDAGIRFTEDGPFKGAGAGYEDADFANQMYAKGFKAYTFNDIYYFHKRRDGTRSGLDTREDGAGVDERKKFLMTKWNKIGFDITHYHEQPPERHLRRIAMMNNLYEGNPGPAGFLSMALKRIGCEVHQFNSLDNPYQETEKHGAFVEGYFDNFIFVDDSDWGIWTCPEWGHPSVFWAIDMYDPSCWPYKPPEEYFERMKTFDQACSISDSAVDFCVKNGLNAFHLPHAGNEDYHKPYDVERKYDWVAVWSNVSGREEYSAAALEKFPGGLLASGLWGDEYPKTVSMGKCALSKARGFEYPARVVETMMIGTPLVSYRDRFLDMFFKENEHYLGFSDTAEMVEKIQWVNDNLSEALEMAKRARAEVLARHRYYHRALRLFAGDW